MTLVEKAEKEFLEEIAESRKSIERMFKEKILNTLGDLAKEGRLYDWSDYSVSVDFPDHLPILIRWDYCNAIEYTIPALRRGCGKLFDLREALLKSRV